MAIQVGGRESRWRCDWPWWVRGGGWAPLVTVLVTKLLVLGFGAAVAALAGYPMRGMGDVLAVWNRWDAPHYLDLARYGYESEGERRLFIVFFPLYPWLVRVVAWGVGDFLVAAFIVSGVSSVAAGLLLFRLVRLDAPEDVARRAVLALFLFPTGYFLHIGYTESLFLALTLGAFLAARKGRWGIAGALGGLAGLTRLNGLLLFPALAAEAYDRYRRLGRLPAGCAWLVVIPLGTAVYLLLNFWVMGDPLAFVAIQRSHWHKSLGWPWVGLRETFRSLFWRTPYEAHMVGFQELFYAAVGLAATVAAARCLRPSYTLWMGLNWLLSVSTTFVLSVPRYTLMLFPLFPLVAHLPPRSVWWRAYLTWSVGWLGYFSSQFALGRWAF